MNKEITPKEYFIFLIKKGKIIIFILFLTFVISTIINFLVLKPIYKSSAVMLLPQINNNIIIDQSMAKSKIESPLFISQLAAKTRIKYEAILRNLTIDIPVDTLKTININYLDEDPQNGKNVLNILLNLLIDQNKSSYDSKISSIEDSLKDTEAIVKNLQQLQSTLENNLKNLKIEEGKAFENSIEYTILIETYNANTQNLYQALKDKSYYLQELAYSNNFLFLSFPDTPAIPAGPHKILNIIFSIFLVFFLLLIVFLGEYYLRNRE